jgi:hypothetical protein
MISADYDIIDLLTGSYYMKYAIPGNILYLVIYITYLVIYHMPYIIILDCDIIISEIQVSYLIPETMYVL